MACPETFIVGAPGHHRLQDGPVRSPLTIINTELRAEIEKALKGGGV